MERLGRKEVGMPTLTEHPAAISLKNILVATDFSEASEATLPYAAGLGAIYDSRILIVHVIPPLSAVSFPPGEIPLLLRLDRERAEKSMETLLTAEPLAGARCESAIVEGELAIALNYLIKERDIDLAIVGTHGRGGLKKFVLGSVAESLFRTVACPVLTVKSSRSAKSTIEPVRAILYATDFSEGSMHAWRYALSLSEAYRADLLMLHVIDAHEPSVSVEGNDTSAEEQLREMVPRGLNVGHVETIVREGHPSEEIVRIAGERAADLIVMGSRAEPHWQTLHLPWSTAHQIIAHASCPVLTVRNGARAGDPL